MDAKAARIISSAISSGHTRPEFGVTHLLIWPDLAAFISHGPTDIKDIPVVTRTNQSLIDDGKLDLGGLGVNTTCCIAAAIMTHPDNLQIMYCTMLKSSSTPSTTKDDR